ncbi:MAG: ribosome maturation factor RimP [Candidatus Tyrphobacter sp.]
MSLFVTIDRPGGADLVLCERVAQRINALLGVIDAAYELSVESAGLERPLVRPTDYERFAGSRVRVVTSLLVGGAKTHRGILRGLRGENVLLETKGGDVLLPHATIKAANLEFDPRADLTAEKRERKGFHGRNHN